MLAPKGKVGHFWGMEVKDKQIPSTTFSGLVVKQLVKFKEFLNKSSVIDVSVAALLIYNYSLSKGNTREELQRHDSFS